MERHRSIWRFDRVTGYWKHEREVWPDTEKQWLAMFQRDKPMEVFKVSRDRPRMKPGHLPGRVFNQ